jgi:hypothetical protein
MFKLSVYRATLLAAALVLPAAASAHVTTRVGNIYNGQNHEPWAPEVYDNETAAGVAPSQQQLMRQDRDVDAIGQLLLDRAKRAAQKFGTGLGTGGVEPGGVVKIEPEATAS